MMTESNRIELIKKIEKIRKSKVITYIVSDRPKIRTGMEDDDLRELYEHIRLIKPGTKIDLFIYSLGGDAVVAWALANLIKEYSNDFNVLVPFRAFSCATSLAAGANKIVMHKAGILGPVDPLVGNPFNPIIQGRMAPISVEDVGGYLALIKEKFDIKDQANVTKGFEILSSAINPLALGNVYRHYLKSRDDIRKLLELHLEPKKEKERIDRVIEILVEKLYYHGHHINRKEAKEIGLEIEFAEKFSDGKDNLSDIMWKLFEEYEKDLELKIPYRDELPKKGDTNEIPIKFVESSNLSSTNIIEQKMVDFGFPENTVLIHTGGQPGIFIPGTTSQPIPINCEGQPIVLNNKIYDKREIAYWKRKTIA